MKVDPEILAIDKAMLDQGKRRADLGRLLGLDSSQVTRLFKGERRLQRAEYAKVMSWLGLSGAPAAESRGGAIVPMPGMVPLYGWLDIEGAAQLQISDGFLRGFVPMHPAQAHVVDAFALEVGEITMSPRYELGEVIFMAPRRWPRGEQDCVVMLKDGGAHVGRWLGRDETTIRLGRFNPREELSVPSEDIETVHTVVGRG